jgi:hypothetical protein
MVPAHCGWVLGSYGGLNFGDEAILRCVLRCLRGLRPDADVGVFAHEGIHTKRHHGPLQTVAWEGARLRERLRRSKRRADRRARNRRILGEYQLMGEDILERASSGTPSRAAPPRWTSQPRRQRHDPAPGRGVRSAVSLPVAPRRGPSRGCRALHLRHACRPLLMAGHADRDGDRPSRRRVRGAGRSHRPSAREVSAARGAARADDPERQPARDGGQHSRRPTRIGLAHRVVGSGPLRGGATRSFERGRVDRRFGFG